MGLLHLQQQNRFKIQLNRTDPDPDGAEGHNNLNTTERCCSMSSSEPRTLSRTLHIIHCER